MIQAVIFDLDDTLYLERDYMRSGYRYIAGILAERYSIDPALAFKRMCMFSDQGKPVFDSVLASFGVPYDADTISAIVTAYRYHNPVIRFCPDTLPAITALRKMKLKLCILTGGHAIVQRKKIKALGAQALFDSIIIAEEHGGPQKPSPVPFSAAAAKLGVKPEETVCVGDNPQKDFFVGVVYPVTTVRILREGGLYTSAPYYKGVREHYRIGKLSELPKLIASMQI